MPTILSVVKAIILLLCSIFATKENMTVISYIKTQKQVSQT